MLSASLLPGARPAGRSTIGKVRGKPITMADGTRLIVTIHPSALLRVEDEDERHAAYQNFVADLKAAMAAHSGEAPRKKSKLKTMAAIGLKCAELELVLLPRDM